jgi:hypothetical protein
MGTLLGTSPNGKTPREIDCEILGEEVEIRIHPPSNVKSGQKITVKAGDLRSVPSFTDFTLRGTSPASGTPREIAAVLRDELSVYVYPLVEDASGELIEGEGGWAIWLRPMEWQDCLTTVLSS